MAGILHTAWAIVGLFQKKGLKKPHDVSDLDNKLGQHG